MKQKITHRTDLWRAKMENKLYRANYLFSKAKHRAGKNKIEFSITKQWFIDKINQGTCELSGIPFVLYMKSEAKTNPFAPSPDRIDPSKGYTEENCRMILSSLNMALNEFGLDHLLLITDAVKTKLNTHIHIGELYEPI